MVGKSKRVVSKVELIVTKCDDDNRPTTDEQSASGRLKCRVLQYSDALAHSIARFSSQPQILNLNFNLFSCDSISSTNPSSLALSDNCLELRNNQMAEILLSFFSLFHNQVAEEEKHFCICRQ